MNTSRYDVPQNAQRRPQRIALTFTRMPWTRLFHGRMILLALVMVSVYLTVPPAIGQEPSQNLGNQNSSDVTTGKSALPWIAGFDLPRIQSALYEDPSELARLIYRISRIAPNRLTELCESAADMSSNVEESESIDPQLGDAVLFRGTVVRTDSVQVPAKLVEFLGFKTLRVAEILPSDSKRMLVYSVRFPRQVKAGDQFAGAGIWLDPQEGIVASPKIQWFPQKASSPALKELVRLGFDLSLLGTMSKRDRSPLGREDADAFYGLLSLSKNVPQAESSDGKSLPPSKIDPIKLLAESKKHIGHWIRLEIESAQVSRVMVTDPQRVRQIGQDYYYQIDGFTDLGNRQVVVRGNAETQREITFDGRYPVSLVSRQLPDQISFTPADVSRKIRQRLTVDGFMMRLWSYETDLFRNAGSGSSGTASNGTVSNGTGAKKQFGPLIVVQKFAKRNSTAEDPAGVKWIGGTAAAVFTLALLVLLLWGRSTRRSDQVAKRGLPDQVHLDANDTM